MAQGGKGLAFAGRIAAIPLLFVIFACGTPAYFQGEIIRWMQPNGTTGARPERKAQGTSTVSLATGSVCG